MVRCFGEAAGQLAQRVGGQAADLRRPVGALRRTVALAQQMGQELVEAGGVAVEEFLVVQAFDVQGVGDTEHHRDVGVRTRRQPFAVEGFAGLGEHGVDGQHLTPAFFTSSMPGQAP